MYYSPRYLFKKSIKFQKFWYLDMKLFGEISEKALFANNGFSNP